MKRFCQLDAAAGNTVWLIDIGANAPLRRAGPVRFRIAVGADGLMRIEFNEAFGVRRFA